MLERVEQIIDNKMIVIALGVTYFDIELNFLSGNAFFEPKVKEFFII